MEVTAFDPDKVAVLAVSGWNDLDPEQRNVVKAAVRNGGGYRLEIEPADDGTVTVRMAGVIVARVPTWRVLKAPAMPPADA